MMWFFGVLIVLVIGAVVVVAVGEGKPLARVYDDRRDVTVPADRPLDGADLRAVRFTTAVRGYRASEVDALLDRLAAQIDGLPGPDAPRPGSDEGGTDSGTLGR
ncbi:DivIVA domain-containing protein [Marmoricola sp. RAF53]|uniref:DivIVA domain-containing protein n=1 Tax=Marmoricola sp. RAF53 TaxID=3233059 RepID=UPI003F9E3C8F